MGFRARVYRPGAMGSSDRYGVVDSSSGSSETKSVAMLVMTQISAYRVLFLVDFFGALRFFVGTFLGDRPPFPAVTLSS